MQSSLVVLVFAALFVCAIADGSLGRNFGDTYDWKLLEAGLKEAEATGKPAMVVIHKSWCGACKALGPKIAQSKEVQELAKDFVMINVHDDEEPNEERWKPDGGYIPRVIFYDSLHGEVLPDIINAGGNPKYKYFYMSDMDVASSMKKVKNLFESDEYKAKVAAKAEL